MVNQTDRGCTPSNPFFLSEHLPISSTGPGDCQWCNYLYGLEGFAVLPTEPRSTASQAGLSFHWTPDRPEPSRLLCLCTCSVLHRTRQESPPRQNRRWVGHFASSISQQCIPIWYNTACHTAICDETSLCADFLYSRSLPSTHALSPRYHSFPSRQAYSLDQSF